MTLTNMRNRERHHWSGVTDGQVNPLTNLDHLSQRYIYLLLSHLADVFIQIDLQLIQIHVIKEQAGVPDLTERCLQVGCGH